MTIEYELTASGDEAEGNLMFNSKMNAKHCVEQKGGYWTLITWNVQPNNPGCLPEKVYRCCGLEIYDDGKWTTAFIYRG